jgi:outer membrane protein assembly factor BamB
MRSLAAAAALYLCCAGSSGCTPDGKSAPTPTVKTVATVTKRAPGGAVRPPDAPGLPLNLVRTLKMAPGELFVFGRHLVGGHGTVVHDLQSTSPPLRAAQQLYYVGRAGDLLVGSEVRTAHIITVDPLTLTERWRYAVDPQYEVLNAVAGTPDLVLAAVRKMASGEILALRASDGKLAWKHPGRSEQLWAVDDLVLSRSKQSDPERPGRLQDTVTALDSRSGAQRWSVTPDTGIDARIVGLGPSIVFLSWQVSPTIRGVVSFLDPKNGRTIRKLQVESRNVAAWFDEDTTYLLRCREPAAKQGALTLVASAYDTRTGTRLWESQPEGVSGCGPTSVTGGRGVVFGHTRYAGQLFAWDRKNGSRVFHYGLGSHGQFVVAHDAPGVERLIAMRDDNHALVFEAGTESMPDATFSVAGTVTHEGVPIAAALVYFGGQWVWTDQQGRYSGEVRTRGAFCHHAVSEDRKLTRHRQCQLVDPRVKQLEIPMVLEVFRGDVF